MALVPYEGFIGPGYTGRSISFACDRTINLYTERNEVGTGQHPWALLGTPGLKKLFYTGKDQPIRGICTIGGKRILVAGRDELYEINPATLAVETLGEIAPDVTWDGLQAVQFAWNGVQYCISSGGHGYILDGDTLTETIPISQVQSLDGYFIGLQPWDRKVRLSGLYDGLTWNELDYREKETQRDYPTAILADHGELWVFGEYTSEVWYNSGNSDYILERVPNGRLELGCAASFSPAKIDNSLCWIGNDERGNRVVWRADGYSAKRISNHAIEYRMNLMIPQVSGASITSSTTVFSIGWAYQEEGHSFYCLAFPNAPEDYRRDKQDFSNPTMLVYDFATGHWHERAWWNKARGRYEPPRQRCHAFIWDHHLVGDRENGWIYEQHLSYLDDAGDRIRRERIGPALGKGMKQIFYNSFQLDLETGTGLGAIPSNLYGPDQFGLYYSV